MEINFFTKETIGELWGYLRMLLEGVSPGVMIVSAIAGVGLLIGIITSSFRKSSKENDDEIEIRRY